MFRTDIEQIVNDALVLDSTPINQQTYSTDDLIAFADQALQSTIVPLVKRCWEEYFVVPYPMLVDGTTVRLDIPSSAAGLVFRDLYFYDPSNPNKLLAVALRVNPDAGIPSGSGGLFYGRSCVQPQYYIENNSLIFNPPLQRQYLAKLRILKEPNHLTRYALCAGQITAISSDGSKTVTVDNIPFGGNIPPNLKGLGDWTINTGVNATTLDVLQPVLPFNFRFSSTTNYPLHDVPIVSADINTNTVGLDADTFASVKLGDFLVTNQLSPFVQFMPEMAYNLLRYLISMKVLKAQGDVTNFNLTTQLYNQAAADFQSMITPKAQNMSEKVGAGLPAPFSNSGLRRWF